MSGSNIDSVLVDAGRGPHRPAPMAMAFVVLVAGLLPAAFLLAIPLLPAKWYIFSLLVLAATALTLIFRNNKLFHLGLLAFSLCLNLDIHIMLVPSLLFPYSYQAHHMFYSTRGFLIPLTLFPMIFLYARWFWDAFVRKERFTLSRSGLLLLIILFVFAALSLGKSPDQQHTLFELFVLAQGILLYLYLSMNIRSRRELRVIIYALIIGVALQGLVASLQYITGSYLGLGIFGESERQVIDMLSLAAISRAAGTLGHPNSLAMYLEILMPIALGFALLRKPGFLKIFLFAAVAVGSTALIFTLSRAGITLTILTVSLLVLFWGKRCRRLGIVSGLVILSLAIAVLLILYTENPVSQRLFKDEYQSAYSRMPMMSVAFRMIEQNLYSGVGLNTYVISAPSYDYTIDRISLVFPLPVHNIYLLVLAEIGVFGLAAFLLFLIGVIRKGFKTVRAADLDTAVIGLGLTLGLVAFLFHGLVDLNYISKNFTFWFICGTIAGLWNFSRKNSSRKTASGTFPGTSTQLSRRA